MAILQDITHRTQRTNGTRNLSQVKKIARHHSATTDGDFDAFWKHWHYNRGWGTGGYHEIILRDGTVQICYRPEEITNGVANQNTSLYHICVVGNGSFTEAQEKAFDERARVAMRRFGLSVSDIQGHNEFPGTNTSCPGIDMRIVRNRLANDKVDQVSKPVSKPQTQPKPSKPSTSTKKNYTSVVDYLNNHNMASNFSARNKLASRYGIKNYTGSSAQNVKLLNLLQGNKTADKSKKSIKQMADEVVKGIHGNGHAQRQKSLGVGEATYEKVRKEVNKRL